MLEGLDAIQAYVIEPMNRLRGTLSGHESRTVHCVDSQKMAMIISPEEGRQPWNAFCHFCGLSELDESFRCDQWS